LTDRQATNAAASFGVDERPNGLFLSLTLASHQNAVNLDPNVGDDDARYIGVHNDSITRILFRCGLRRRVCDYGSGLTIVTLR
jgi:hypothetical protein